MRKIVEGKKLDLLRVKKHILVHAGMLVELMRILHFNRVQEKFLALPRYDSHVALRARVIRDTMIMKNYGLAIAVALRHRRDDIPFDDIKGYGLEGLIKAVDGFDPRKGYKFSSYAGACIVNTIMRRIIEEETFIRLPEHRVVEKKRKKREQVKAYMKGSEPPRSLKEEERIEPEISFSIDDCREGDDGDKLVAQFASESTTSPENFVLQKSKEAVRVRAVAVLKENLSESEWFILQRRFCSETEKPMTLRKMGEVLGLSHENVNKKIKLSLGKAQRVLSRNGFTRGSFFR